MTTDKISVLELRPVCLTGANQIVGRIYVQSCDAFCNQTLDLLLGEVDCDAGIAKGAKFLGIGRDFMQNCDDNFASASKSAPNDIKTLVLRHDSL